MDKVSEIFNMEIEKYNNLFCFNSGHYFFIFKFEDDDINKVASYHYNDEYVELENYDYDFDLEAHNILFGVNNDLIDSNNDKSDSSEQLTNPPRYATQSGKQLIELLRDDLLTKEEYIGFLKGNLYKYVFRYQSKGGLDDLKKAQYYLEELQKIVGDRVD